MSIENKTHDLKPGESIEGLVTIGSSPKDLTPCNKTESLDFKTGAMMAIKRSEPPKDASEHMVFGYNNQKQQIESGHLKLAYEKTQDSVATITETVDGVETPIAYILDCPACRSTD